MKKLTPGQAHAMFVLLQGKAVGVLVRKGRDSGDTTPTGDLAPWCLRVNSVSARALVGLGYARETEVLSDGREVRGEDLVRFLGYWKTKYEVTQRGIRAWKAASARDRYGLSPSPTMRRGKP